MSISTAIITSEFLSILVCVVLLLGNIFAQGEKTKRHLIYSVMVLTCIIACAADAISWILESQPQNVVGENVTTFIALALPFVLIAEFVHYLTVYIEEQTEISRLPLKIFTVFTAISVLITLATCINGTLFTFENGVYEAGPIYVGYVIANIASMLLALVIVFIFRKHLSTRDCVVVFLYLLIPACAAVINIFAENLSFAFPATMLSLLLIYVMVQSDTVGKLEHEGRVVTHHATHDEMTGLKNRRAFYNRTAALKTEEGTSGVIYCDMNRLKYTNDLMGHKAGDTLIIRFANLLASFFRKDEIYRIGGDEFIIILENVSEEAFETRLRGLKIALTQEEQPIASVGATFGDNDEIDDLIKDAEAIMYFEKERFHEKYPDATR